MIQTKLTTTWIFQPLSCHNPLGCSSWDSSLCSVFFLSDSNLFLNLQQLPLTFKYPSFRKPEINRWVLMYWRKNDINGMCCLLIPWDRGICDEGNSCHSEGKLWSQAYTELLYRQHRFTALVDSHSWLHAASEIYCQLNKLKGTETAKAKEKV